MPTIPSTPSPASFEAFGALLRFLRRRARLTQREVAIAVGYSESQISRFEQGHRPPDEAALRALFLPALAVEAESDWAQRLLALATVARAANDDGQTGLDGPPLPDNPAARLLATKLFRPRPTNDLVPRPRLVGLCAAALSTPLTLVAAPAGSGKTTLLSSWLQQLDPVAGGAQSPRYAWLALDEHDNDPVTFLRYLVAALQTLAPGAGSDTLALLRTPLPLYPLLLAPLINDLATLADDCVLVLDDYHLLTTPEIHRLVDFLLEHLPPRLRLVIASREDPPLPLARMRARRQLLEIRGSDLRFTGEEATRLLRDVMGIPLTAALVAEVEGHTEGWAAGLQLVGLALNGRPDPAQLIAGLARGNRYLIDYLALEVLDGLPVYLRTFLLQTSILDRLCGPLCDAVLGLDAARADDLAAGAYSQPLLQELERRNLFVVPLDDERRWFRYHHLFAAFLRARLLEGAAERQRRALHQRAGAWLEAHGLVEEAIPHALASTDLAHAARLIDRVGLQLASRGHILTVLGWLRSFPEQALREYPALCLIYGVLLLNTRQLAAASTWLDAAEQALGAAPTQEERQALRGGLLVVRASVARITGDLERCVADSARALELLEDGPLMFRGIAMLNSALGFLVSGDVTAESEQRARLAIALTERAGNPGAHLSALVTLSLLHTLQGRRHLAGEVLAQVVQRLDNVEARLLSGAAAGYLVYGAWLREQNLLDEAERQLATGWELAADSSVDGHIVVVGLMAQVRLSLAVAGPAGAEQALRRCERLAQEHPAAPQILAQLSAARALVDLAAGDVVAAARWAVSVDPAPDKGSGFLREREHLTLARVWLALAQAQDTPELLGRALALLGRLLADAEARGRVDSVLRIRIVQVLALQAGGETDEALETLGGLLARAAPESYVRLFVDEGLAAAALLRAARARGIEPEYCTLLLTAFPSATTEGDAQSY